ncbi:MAG: hypothetical protein GXO71_04445 [Caldiserica bacterium]|nr:hypothetical protein [Caldisericota bacterium]
MDVRWQDGASSFEALMEALQEKGERESKFLTGSGIYFYPALLISDLHRRRTAYTDAG